MLTKNLPITREVKKLRNAIIGYTADFPKRFKYTIGDRMINVVLDLNKYIRRANEETNPQNRSYAIRRRLLGLVDREWWKYCYIAGHFQKVVLRRQYRHGRKMKSINELKL